LQTALPYKATGIFAIRRGTVLEHIIYERPVSEYNLKQKVSMESLILAAICTADMTATIIFVALGWACESNPLMAACLRCSIYLFLVVKLASFTPFIFICEHHRKRNPGFVRAVMRVAITLYLVAYIALVTHQNIS